jgi:urocanate hydratase
LLEFLAAEADERHHLRRLIAQTATASTVTAQALVWLAAGGRITLDHGNALLDALNSTGKPAGPSDRDATGGRVRGYRPRSARDLPARATDST